MVPDDVDNVNALLLTHGHFDHASDLPYLVADRNIPVYASAETVRVLSGHPEYQSLNLNPVLPGKRFKTGNFFITPCKAGHVKFDIPLIVRTILRIFKTPASIAKPLAGVIIDFFKYPEGESFAWEVKCGKGSVLIFGSMGFADDVIYPRPDLLILPLQGHSRIFDFAIEAAARIKPAALMPDHFDDSFPPVSDTIDADAFKEIMRKRIPGVRTIVPRHREKINLF